MGILKIASELHNVRDHIELILVSHAQQLSTALFSWYLTHDQAQERLLIRFSK